MLLKNEFGNGWNPKYVHWNKNETTERNGKNTMEIKLLKDEKAGLKNNIRQQ